MLEEWNSGGTAALLLQRLFFPLTAPSGLQEKASSLTVQGNVKLFNGVEGLSQFRPESGRRFAECSKHVFLIFGRYLLLYQEVSRLAVDGVKANHVLAAEASNRPRDA